VAATVTGTTNPTGTVAFSYVLNGGTPVTMCAAASVTPATGVATCTYALPTAATSSAPYTVTAKYSGDTNFGSSSNVVMQAVNPGNLTVAVASSQPTSLVNQAVTFTATLTLANSGAATPNATVAFKDTLTGATLCADVPVTNLTASCPYKPTTQWTAVKHPITATYIGDANFPPTTSAVFSQTVNPGPTTGTVTALPSSSLATESVTFTATVTPAQIGAVVPSGYFTFTSSGVWTPSALCQAAPVAPTGNGAATATCTATFPVNAATQTITAAYSNDPNFAGDTSQVTQTIQNFSITNAVTSTLNPTATTGPVALTQGYSTATSSASGTDPFNPTTVTLVVSSTGGLAGTLAANCVVTNSVQAIVTDPSCVMSSTGTPPTSTTLSGANGTQLIYTLSASAAAPVGAYTVSVTANDTATPALTQSAAPLTLYVVGVGNPLSLAQGASGTESAFFNTTTAASGATLGSFSCSNVWNATTKALLTSSQLGGMICSGPKSVAVTGASTSVPITISTAGNVTAQLQRSNAISMAALLGIPLFAMIGWVGSRKSPRRNFFRFLGLIVLLVGASFASGCGGSFSSSSKTSSTGIAPGSYLVQVVATDQNNNNYYAVIPLEVSSN